MDDFRAAFFTALGLLIGLDRDLITIVCLSVSVSLLAVGLATVVGLPLGAAVAVWRVSRQNPWSDGGQALCKRTPRLGKLTGSLLLLRGGRAGARGFSFTPE